MEAKKIDHLSIKEYVNIEKERDARYEYHDGKIFAMAGGTIEHGLIGGNTYGEIKFQLRNANSKCIVINNDVKLHIEASNKFLYPDVMVVCDELERSELEKNAIVNPTLIIEVLSDSTESYDRGDKFFAYKQIKTLKEYILIDQYKAQVDIYKRKGDLWQITRVEGVENNLFISSLGIQVELKSIYEHVVWK
ncbi:MAG: Uma2 family endonuclease [Bacteroidota bacterium]